MVTQHAKGVCSIVLHIAGLRIQLGRPLRPLLQYSQYAAIGGLAPAGMDQHAGSGLSPSSQNLNTLAGQRSYMLQLAAGLLY